MYSNEVPVLSTCVGVRPSNRCYPYLGASDQLVSQSDGGSCINKLTDLTDPVVLWLSQIRWPVESRLAVASQERVVKTPGALVKEFSPPQTSDRTLYVRNVTTILISIETTSLNSMKYCLFEE